MKRQNLKSTLKTLLAGFCIASGGVAFAGSVTVSGTTGTNPTYIVIPEEYAGKEGQFVATATSSNSSPVTIEEPYINQDYAYVKKSWRSYGAFNFTLGTPSGTSYVGGSKSLSSLERGSYTVSVSQDVTAHSVTYALYRSNWADTEAQTFSDLKYYAQNGTLPASSGITRAPTYDGGSNNSTTTTTGVTIASAYIVVYGVDDGGSGGEVTPPVTGGDSSGGSNIDINITTGTDDGVYTLINSLFSYISEMQSILSASDDAIRSELASYITELQTAYQMADAQLATTIQNQINALQAAMSTSVSDLRTSLENQIAALRNQMGPLQTQQSNLLSEFQTLKGELQTAIAQNSGNIAALSKELAEK